MAPLTQALLALALVPVASSLDVSTGAFVHLFEWSHADVAQECEDWLGPKGFKAVQISPPEEHIQGDQWWTRYQPVSYNLTSRSGTEDELKDMIARCNAVGVSIIADAVVNHMAASPSSTSYGVAGTAYYPGRKFAPYNFDPSLNHHDAYSTASNCGISDYSDMENVQQCDLSGLVDLDTENSETQSIIASYLSKLVGLGAAGVRIDAAKHIHNESLKAFLDKAEGLGYVFQEVIYGDGEAVEPEMYINNGDVTEFRFGTNIYANFNEYVSGKMQYLQTFGEDWGMIPSSSAVVFIDNHDTQRSASNVLTYKDGQYYNVANYFMLAHPYGHPKVMSSYYFSNTDAGPPSVAVHNSDGSVNCDDNANWVCEHRRTGIANMVAFRAATAGTDADSWQFDSSNANRVAFNRGSKGLFALNMDTNAEWNVALTTSLPDGDYCNAITSTDLDNCDDVITVSDGQAKLSVPTLDAVAIFAQN